jgi:hypothetical protein
VLSLRFGPFKSILPVKLNSVKQTTPEFVDLSTSEKPLKPVIHSQQIPERGIFDFFKSRYKPPPANKNLDWKGKFPLRQKNTHHPIGGQKATH